MFKTCSVEEGMEGSEEGAVVLLKVEKRPPIHKGPVPHTSHQFQTQDQHRYMFLWNAGLALR